MNCLFSWRILERISYNIFNKKHSVSTEETNEFEFEKAEHLNTLNNYATSTLCLMEPFAGTLCRKWRFSITCKPPKIISKPPKNSFSFNFSGRKTKNEWILQIWQNIGDQRQKCFKQVFLKFGIRVWDYEASKLLTTKYTAQIFLWNFKTTLLFRSCLYSSRKENYDRSSHIIRC